MNEDARRRLADYLRFQKSLGIEVVRIATARLGALPAASPSLPHAAMQGVTTPSPVVSTRRDDPGPAPAAVLAPTRPSRPEGEAARDLLLVRDDLGECRRCKLHQGRKSIVYGSGNPDAELVFVGEGPGADEDEQGVPFVGRAGQLLTDMIQKGMGLRRDDVYICNVVKCRPPSNRTPEPDECAACTPFLWRQLAAIRPRVVCALGATAAQNLLGRKSALAPLRGQSHALRVGDLTTQLVVTYHPAYLLRDPSQKREAWKDLQFVMQLLGVK